MLTINSFSKCVHTPSLYILYVMHITLKIKKIIITKHVLKNSLYIYVVIYEDCNKININSFYR